ncbi:hypothetical protein Tco_0900241 [Tanacetum coccineum]
MGGLWRDTRLSFLSLNDEQNHRYAALHVDSKSVEYRLIPSAFLPLLLPSLFGAFSNPTTLSRCLRTTGDLGRWVGVASLLGSGVVAENTVVITVGRVVLRLFDLVRMGLIVAGHMDGTTDYANMGMIRLRRDRRVLVMVAGLPSLG